ncbi:glutamyl-tRNA amidotransferase [Opitutaceae bacterium EW11]|nr:glutamyl-tRNA amidotransferase [Opitutaceae bacterium EW11]
MHPRSLVPRTLLLAAAVALGGLRAAAADLSHVTIAELQAAMGKGTITAEKLTELYLARIAAYDKQGPSLNAVIVLNPKALETARALDAERKAKGPRSPIHGIPVVLKDNYDTCDLQTTAGCQLLEGWIPEKDAYVVKKLRDAGAVILAKVNLSEFAAGGSVGVPSEIGSPPNGFSSAGGQTRNPHDLERGPAGSSGGTGAAIAAVFAQFGMGSDTGGSIRGPCAANGIVGLKPTNGLLSRTGIVPLALTFDTGGPMARSVADLAVSLGIMTGVDPVDPLSASSRGKFERDYTRFLRKGSLKGARIGVARDFMGKDPETDRVTEAAISKLKELGADVVDPLPYPEFLLKSRMSLFLTVLNADFKAQIGAYLAHVAATKPGYPRNFAELVAQANDPAKGYRSPEKAAGLKYTDKIALEQSDPIYLAARDQGLPMIRAAMLALFDGQKLDAIVYPTAPRPAALIARTVPLTPSAMGDSATSIANMTGFPDLIVPAGMTKDGLPVSLSFFGPAYSEAKLIGYAYDFEQATHGIALPKTTPLLPEDALPF